MPSSPSSPQKASALARKRPFEEDYAQADASPEHPSNRKRLSDRPTSSLPPKASSVVHDVHPRPDALAPPRKQLGFTSEDPNLTFLSYPSVEPGASSSSSRVPFQQPSPVLSFSYTPVTHTQQFDDSALKAFVDPPLGADLNYGYERWLRKPDERGRLDGLLRAVQKVQEKEREAAEAVAIAQGQETGKGKAKEIGVVAWRGVITK